MKIRQTTTNLEVENKAEKYKLASKNGLGKYFYLVRLFCNYFSFNTHLVFLFSVDNSEYMRNGDFLPTRLQAQQDAVGLITQSKLRSNPESNVGLLTLGCLDGKFNSKFCLQV